MQISDIQDQTEGDSVISVRPVTWRPQVKTVLEPVSFSQECPWARRFIALA